MANCFTIRSLTLKYFPPCNIPRWDVPNFSSINTWKKSDCVTQFPHLVNLIANHLFHSFCKFFLGGREVASEIPCRANHTNHVFLRPNNVAGLQDDPCIYIKDSRAYFVWSKAPPLLYTVQDFESKSWPYYISEKLKWQWKKRPFEEVSPIKN